MPHPSRPRFRRTLAAAALGALPLAGLAVTASAQAPAAPQTITIATAATGVTVSGADALAQGPTRITVSGTGKEVDLTLFELNPGVTQATLAAAAAKLGNKPPTPLQKYGKFVLGASGGKGLPVSTTDLVLAPATYLVVNSTGAPKFVGSFTVGTAIAPTPTPTPDATISLRDYHITAPATLPSTGTIRVKNVGKSPHFLLLLRASSTVDAHKVATLLHKGGPANEKKAMKLLKGEGSLIGLISPTVINDVEVHGIVKGTYVLVCFYGDAKSHMKEHAMLGMETVVKVK